MTAFWRFRHVAKARLGGLVLSLVLSLAALLAGIALLGTSGWFLTAAALTTAAASFNLFGPSALVRGLSMLRILARYGERLAGHDATLRLLASLREWLFRRLVPLVPLDPALWRHGDLVSRLTADIEALDTVLLTAVGPVVTAGLGGLAVSALLAILLPAAVPVFAAGYAMAALLVPVLLVVSGRRLGRAGVEQQAALRIAALDGIEGHADLILCGASSRAIAAFEAGTSRLACIGRRQARQTALAGGATQLVCAATLLGVLWHGLRSLQHGTIGGPALVGVLLATLAGFEAVAALLRSAGRLGTAMAAADRVGALVAQEPRAVRDPVPLPDGADLVLDAVTVRRRPERTVLDRLSLPVRAGERVAITGESGSGKSTLFDLVLGLVEPDSGSVQVAGCDIRRVAEADLHRRIALMSQSSPVFLGTVRDNLLVGRPDADGAALWHALARARLDGMVRALPDGLDTWLGEGGRTLSGGQARRLCLARTLLSPARILLLDEPTSGLDHETEQAFLADLASATDGRTVLLATHAALPAGAVDRVLRLAEGRLS